VTIPRVIHHVWIGRPMPRHLQDCVASWARAHPQWEHQLWTDDALQWIPNRSLYDRAGELLPDHAVPQMQSDLARYAILQRHGGLYVDCDTECRRNVEPALEGHSAFAAAETDRWVGNTYLAAEADHPVMAALVDRVADHVVAYRGFRSAGRMTGPRFLTPIWREFGCHVAPRHLWFPYGYDDVKRGQVPTNHGTAYAVHYWQHTRDVLAARRQRAGAQQ
jgi:inositol phosphorylceramide mannosyltransferase catalytic subunit